MSFNHISKLDIRQARAWMDIPELAQNARLLLRPATQDNPQYFNAMLRRSGNQARKAARTGADLDAATLVKNREEDRELFPDFIMVGWEGVVDDQDQEVAFSRGAAKELCAVLPDWLFDRIRNFAGTPERFLPGEQPTPDPVELVGNSVPGSSGS